MYLDGLHVYKLDIHVLVGLASLKPTLYVFFEVGNKYHRNSKLRKLVRVFNKQILLYLFFGLFLQLTESYIT